MDRTICDRCPWAKEGKAHGGWYYLACYHAPYQGAWVKQIDCPKEKEKENTMKSYTIYYRIKNDSTAYIGGAYGNNEAEALAYFAVIHRGEEYEIEGIKLYK